MNNKITNLALNIAYIDGANLYRGVKSLDQEIDYLRFRRWLLHKYRIKTAYIFLGYLKEHISLYDYLSNAGFELCFKESIKHEGKIKGNSDAEMVLKTVRDYYECMSNNVIIITGDGDFSCLVDFLIEKEVFNTILIPNRKYSSYLLRKKNISITWIEDFLHHFASKKDPQ